MGLGGSCWFLLYLVVFGHSLWFFEVIGSFWWVLLVFFLYSSG